MSEADYEGVLLLESSFSFIILCSSVEINQAIAILVIWSLLVYGKILTSSGTGSKQNLDLNLGIAPLSASNVLKENVEANGFYFDQLCNDIPIHTRVIFILTFVSHLA